MNNIFLGTKYQCGRYPAMPMWLHNLIMIELQNQGVKDVFITCVDDLTGFPEVIKVGMYTLTVQLCIVYIVRNSLNYLSYKDRKKVAADLKKVYGVATEEQAEEAWMNLVRNGIIPNLKSWTTDRSLESAPSLYKGRLGGVKICSRNLEDWYKKYSSISMSWISQRTMIVPFFTFPQDIRKTIYMTNAIESMNMTLRKVLRNHRTFSTDEADVHTPVA